MKFVDGKTVVHPHHGPATVTGVVDRKVGGTRREYVELRVHQNELEVMVPLDQAEEIGLRRVSTRKEIDEILAVLHAPTGEQSTVWSRRMKANQDKLRSGDLLVTAEVLRDLLRRQEEKGISTGERELLRTASRPVLAEIALVLSLDEEEAEAVLHAAVLGPERLTTAAIARRGVPELAAS